MKTRRQKGPEKKKQSLACHVNTPALSSHRHDDSTATCLCLRQGPCKPRLASPKRVPQEGKRGKKTREAQAYLAVVQRTQHPRFLGMKVDRLDALALGAKLALHIETLLQKATKTDVRRLAQNSTQQATRTISRLAKNSLSGKAESGKCVATNSRRSFLCFSLTAAGATHPLHFCGSASHRRQ